MGQRGKGIEQNESTVDVREETVAESGREVVYIDRLEITEMLGAAASKLVTFKKIR